MAVYGQEVRYGLPETGLVGEHESADVVVEAASHELRIVDLVDL